MSKNRRNFDSIVNEIDEEIYTDRTTILFGILTLAIITIFMIGSISKKIKIYWDENNQKNPDDKDKDKSKPKTSKSDMLRIMIVIVLSTLFMLMITYISNDE